MVPEVAGALGWSALVLNRRVSWGLGLIWGLGGLSTRVWGG